MYPLIRPATEEEIKSIAEKSDLTYATAVVAMGDSSPMLGVMRTCTELDPVHFPEGAGDKAKALFIWGVLSAVKMSNLCPEIYCNINASDEKWKTAVEGFGFEPVFTVPTLRYKKVLR